MSCFRESVFSSKCPISVTVHSSYQAWSNQNISNEKPVYNPIIYFFPGHLRFRPVPTRYTQQSALIGSGFIPITNSNHLWWSRSMATKAGIYEGCWPVCLWTYVTSEAQAVEHVCTIVRNMFCWSLQSPLSQCAMSGLTLPTPLATDHGLTGFILSSTEASLTLSHFLYTLTSGGGTISIKQKCHFQLFAK